MTGDRRRDQALAEFRRAALTEETLDDIYCNIFQQPFLYRTYYAAVVEALAPLVLKNVRTCVRCDQVPCACIHPGLYTEVVDKLEEARREIERLQCKLEQVRQESNE